LSPWPDRTVLFAFVARSRRCDRPASSDSLNRPEVERRTNRVSPFGAIRVRFTLLVFFLAVFAAGFFLAVLARLVVFFFLAMILPPWTSGNVVQRSVRIVAELAVRLGGLFRLFVCIAFVLTRFVRGRRGGGRRRLPWLAAGLHRVLICGVCLLLLGSTFHHLLLYGGKEQGACPREARLSICPNCA
jgi:hypothetical protein